MKTIEDLKKKLHKEIEELAQKENLSTADVEMLYKLTCIKKNLLTNEAMEAELEGGEEEYSHRGGREGGGGQRRGGGGYSREGGYSGDGDYSYDEGGNSYARRGGRRRRDAMGRFTRGYSRDGGYSYHDGSEEMAEMMEDMMEDLPPEERQAAMRLLKRMRNG